MKKILLICFSLAMFWSLTSCVDDLDTEPKIEQTLEQLLAEDPSAIEGILSRLYASFALSGPNGPGSSDISDDAGESPFLRGIVNLQDFTEMELTTLPPEITLTNPQRLVLGSFLVIFGLLIFISILSYFFTGESDQSILNRFTSMFL
jgi:hypothetical protein